MEKSVAILVIVNFLIMGLSHIFQRDAWKEFFVMLHAKGRVGAFINGFLTLGIGSLIVAFHNVWTGIPTLLTLIGWAYLVKSTIIFLRPEWGLRSMKMAHDAHASKLIAAGVVMISVALVLLFSLWNGYPTA